MMLALSLSVMMVNAQETTETVTVEPEVIETEVVTETATPEPTIVETVTPEPQVTETQVATEVTQVAQVVTEEPTQTATPTATPTNTPTATPTVVVIEATEDTSSSGNGSAQLISSSVETEDEEEDVELFVSYTEPTTYTNSVAGTLSIVGANFTELTTVRLDGYGFLQTTHINESAMTAILPTLIPAGKYSIDISDPSNGSDTSPNTLRVYEETLEATAVPGQPTLTVRNFSASPASILPDGTTTLTFDVYNAGNRTAQGIVVSLGSSEFAPANGQASVTLADISPFGSYTVSLAVTASSSLTEGIATIPVSLAFRDETGQTYSNSATLSVNILEEEEPGNSQIVLDSYLVTPNVAYPGDSVSVQALFKNTGSETAKQVLVQVSDGVLIAGSQGNAFSLGDIPAGSVVPVTMPLTIASDAEAGSQAQSLAISYLQDGEVNQTTASIALQIEEIDEESPILLLQSYASSADELLPGQQFTFTLTLQNAGQVDMTDMLLTFGSLSISESSSSDSITTSTTVDSNFLPYGGGDTILLGALPAGETITTTQDFIVSNDLSNGVYTLKMAVSYDADGTSVEQTLNASLIVNTVPRLRITQENELDDPLTAGESYTLSLNIANLGDNDVITTEVHVSGTNLTITEGDVILMETLSGDDDTTENVTFEPDESGDYTLVVDVLYIDDLNRTRTFTQTFTGTVEEAQTTTQRRPDMTQITTETETSDDDDLIGRVLLGFLGLGG